MPELGGHLEAAGAAAPTADREAFEVLVVGGEGLFVCDGPDRVRLLDGIVLLEARPDLRHQVGPDNRGEVVAGGESEEPSRSEHEVVLEPRVAAPDPLEEGAEGVVLCVSP